jgi:putative FmdB family regulatory protein
VNSRYQSKLKSARRETAAIFICSIVPSDSLSGCLRFESGATQVYNFLIHFSTGGNMPHYEFFCLDCKKLFSKILSLVDYEEGEVVCPHCRSKNVEQRWSAFTVITSKKSA